MYDGKDERSEYSGLISPLIIKFEDNRLAKFDARLTPVKWSNVNPAAAILSQLAGEVLITTSSSTHLELCVSHTR